MRAVVCNGPRDVGVVTVPDARLDRPADALVRITSTNICGSDLHMSEGRTSVERGKVLGHENLGEVVEVGPAVARIKKADRVALPFNVACGYCRNRERASTGFCLTMNPGSAGAADGYADVGPYSGGQAECLTVPYADFNCLRLPDDAVDKEEDYVMLTDIFPTGYHATELAGVRPGDTVVVYGSGPVALLASYSTMLRGAARVFTVDRHPHRLKLAACIGATPIDDSKDDPVERVKELTGGRGADCGSECMGWPAHDPEGADHPNAVVKRLVGSVRATGRVGGGGVYPPEDSEGPDTLMEPGQIALDVGAFFTKELRMGTGQRDVKRYNRALRDPIHAGRAKPSFIVSHRLPLEQAPDAYKHFDARETGWTKVVLRPGS